jgi:hypothetical protein
VTKMNVGGRRIETCLDPQWRPALKRPGKARSQLIGLNDLNRSFGNVLKLFLGRPV